MSCDTAETPSAATTSTQQPTQSTDDGSQPAHVADDNLWGSLIPCSPILPQYKLYKSKPKYVIGRSSECDIAIASRFISSHHCSIEWDGDIGPKSSVTVTDHSRYGTFVNGNKIEKAAILRDGHEISFGTSKPRPKEGGIHDYRYIYRHLAYKPPSGGVHSVYDMQHELGKGSYATVVKALHKQEGRWYAIKIISTHKLRGNWTDEVALEGLPKTDGARRLLREITVLERLEHKNICQLKEVFVHSRNVYLVLELVPGGDLVRYLMQLEKRGRRMKEQEARHITYQICDALAYVHRHGIAHRDLKPENVLLTNDNPPVVKVADFGLAKVIDTLTMLHTICGTPIYLAPEVVLRGSDGYSQIVDSWSVGMITLIILTMDMQPVLGVNPKADLKTQVENRRVNWELLWRNRVSEQGEDFIRSLLQDDPAKRMTLEDACTHPWLASPTKPEPASDAPSRPRSHTPHDVPALDSRLASIHVDPEAGAPAPARPRSCSTSDESGGEEVQSGSFVRRADVLARARETGRPLPAPSQEMQERVAAAEDEDDEERDRDDVEGREGGARTPSPGPEDDAGITAQKRKMADRSGSSLYSSGEHVEPASKGAPASSTAHTSQPAAEVPDRKGSSMRPPASKKPRNRSTPEQEDDLESEEIPGLTLPRRSARLNR